MRSLLPKIHQLRCEIELSDADVICYSETWLHAEIEDCLIDLPGYDLNRCDCRNKLGGGLCTYVKSGAVVVAHDEFNIMNSNLEMLVIEIKNEYCRDMFVVNLYRPRRVIVISRITH